MHHVRAGIAAVRDVLERVRPGVMTDLMEACRVCPGPLEADIITGTQRQFLIGVNRTDADIAQIIHEHLGNI